MPGSRAGPNRPTETQIARRAQTIWRAKGCPTGTLMNDWRQAEAELCRELNAAQDEKPPVNAALHGILETA